MTDEEQRAKNAEKQRQWRANNRERAQEQAREDARRWRIANPERSREINRESAKRTRDVDPEAARAKQREVMRKWRAANPDKARKPSAQRKAVQGRYDKSEKGRVRSLRAKAKRRGQPWGKLDYIVRNARSRAKKRGIVFDDRLLEMAFTPPTTCPCCGVELDYTRGMGQSARAPSFDRMVANAGYVIGNVAIICMRCNGIKNEGTAEDHRRIADYIDRCLQHADQPPRENT